MLISTTKKYLDKINQKVISTRLYNSYLCKDKINGFEWGALVIILFFACISVYYYDISCTVDNSILLLKSIWHGEFFHYYDYTIGKTQTVWPPNYEILMYIILAIWNIPLAIANKLCGLDYLYSMPAILWTKLFLVICLLIVTNIIYRICIEMNVDKKTARLAQFLFLSSVNVMTPTLMISQCDIVNLVFIMLGIYMYLKKNTVAFIVCFAIAIPLKMFALFIFVPLVVIDEKKILKIILKVALSLSLLVFCKLISWPSVSYHYLVGSFSKVMAQTLQNSILQLGIGTISIFIAGLVAICIYIYSKQFDEGNRNQYIVYIPLAVFSIMFCFFAFYPYWIVLMVPFTVICIVNNYKYLKLNILLETLSGITAFISCVFCYQWVYSDETMKDLLPSKITNVSRKYNYIASLLNNYGIDKYKNAIFSVFVVSVLAILIINHPKKNKFAVKSNIEIEHSVIGFRILMLLLVASLWISIWFIKAPVSIVDTTTENQAVNTEESILKENNAVIQKFEVKNNAEISCIKLKFYNEAISHINVSEVVLQLIDCSNNEVLVSQRVGTSMLDDNYYKFKINKLVKSGVYEVKITGRNDNGLIVCPKLTNTLVYSKYPVEVNDKVQNNNLYFKVEIK